MRDRTVIQTSLVAPATIPPVVIIIADPVRVERSSTSTDDGANNCALLTTNRRAYGRSCTSTDAGCQFIAVAIPK